MTDARFESRTKTGSGAADAIDLLSTAVVLVDAQGFIVRANAAAEGVFDLSRRLLEGHELRALFVQHAQIDELLAKAQTPTDTQIVKRQFMAVRRSLREPLPVWAVATIGASEDCPLVIELTESRLILMGTREERRSDGSEANRRLLRNLAHEIKNPLGGIRGAAQLLEFDLASAEQREFTRVIISESDRLQSLLDRVLVPHRGPRSLANFNIHEVCERVRSVILAEFPEGLTIVRNYDASVPEVQGDLEQFIQAILNLTRNAAQALNGRIQEKNAVIEIRSRIARQVTFANRHSRLALDLRVIDNGPGVPDDIRDRIFDPLVSGREGGSGLGLALVQTLIQEHEGMIDFDSEPGRTEFRILLPLDQPVRKEKA